MSLEIERKFLVDPSKLPELHHPHEIEQGYLTVDPEVRVRIVAFRGECFAFLTVKSGGDFIREETEIRLLPDDARKLYAITTKKLTKRRYALYFEGLRWEVDHFPDRDLWLAEVELQAPDQVVALPPWVTQDVTMMVGYKNRNLAR